MQPAYLPACWFCMQPAYLPACRLPAWVACPLLGLLAYLLPKPDSYSHCLTALSLWVAQRCR